MYVIYERLCIRLLSGVVYWRRYWIRVLDCLLVSSIGVSNGVSIGVSNGVGIVVY